MVTTNLVQSTPGQRKTCETLFKIGSARGPATSKSKLLRHCMQERMSLLVQCAPTGAGKEGEDKISVVVTPLNLLGKQIKEALDAAGINGICSHY